ncbi:MAG: Gfo/Idh/MocA family oxidoreductase [bacterium]
MSKGEKIRYGIIGAGSMAKGHIESLFEIPEAEITAVADPYKPSLDSKKKLIGERYKTRFLDNYEDLLNISEIDAVVVAVPNYLHANVTINALKAGKHVLCEKPMATTVADCDRMIKVAKKSGKVLQIGLEYRSSSLYNKISRMITSGRIGDIKMMWCKEFRDPFAKKVDDWIIMEKHSGGSLVEKDCHHFDIFNWFINSRPKRVVAFGGKDAVYRNGGDNFLMREQGFWAERKASDAKPDVIDNAWVTVEYTSGAKAMLGLCFFFPFSHELEIGGIGDKGAIISSDAGKSNEVKHYKLSKDKRHRKRTFSVDINKAKGKLSHGGNVYLEHLNFIKSIKSGIPPVADGEIGKWSVIVPLAAERSIKEERIININ